MSKQNERNAGRKPMYGVPSKLKGVLIRIDKEKEMMAEIKAIQEKYKNTAIVNHANQKTE